jgi:tRNA (cmo5U34)-methyltransferase
MKLENIESRVDCANDNTKCITAKGLVCNYRKNITLHVTALIQALAASVRTTTTNENSIKNKMNKSTVEEIRQRFDNDVERFSNLDTGQISTIDAKISLELITDASKRIIPNAENLLDIGCGGGNYSLMMLTKIPNLNCTLVDLSKPMLDKAFERVSQLTNNKVTISQGDIREVNLKENQYDIILAGAVLHHLRDDKDWETTFKKIFKLLRPGGCLMISDFISQDTELLNDYFMERYGDYLEGLNGKEYRQKVLDYVAKEDSPRSMNYQLDLMKQVGFSKVEILHKNMCFGAFGGIK